MGTGPGTPARARYDPQMSRTGHLYASGIRYGLAESGGVLHWMGIDASSRARSQHSCHGM